MQSQDDVTVTACAADVERAGAATAANAPEMEQEAQVRLQRAAAILARPAIRIAVRAKGGGEGNL